MHFYTVQLLMILYAFCAAKQQSGVVADYRNYVPIGTNGVKLLHQYGALKTIIVVALVSLLQQGLYAHLAAPFVGLLWYSLAFDLWINHLTRQPLLYVGHTAWMDRKLWDWFGKHGGKRKVQICVAGIVLLNVLYIVL